MKASDMVLLLVGGYVALRVLSGPQQSAGMKPVGTSGQQQSQADLFGSYLKQGIDLVAHAFDVFGKKDEAKPDPNVGYSI